MSITGKIRFGLGILLAFFVLQFLLGQYVDRGTQASVDLAVTKNFSAAEQLADLAVVGQQIRRFEKEYFIYATDPAGRTKYNKEWSGAYEKLKTNLANIDANAAGAFSKADVVEFGKWKTALDFYASEFRKIMALAEESKLVVAEAPDAEAKPGSKAVVVPVADLSKSTKVANDMIGPGKDKFREILDGADKMRKAKIVESTASVGEIGALFKRGALISMAIFALGLAIAVYMMISVPAAVKNPIDEFVALADKISKGDTKQMIHAEGAVEFAGLSKALERLRVAQAGMIERMRGKAGGF